MISILLSHFTRMNSSLLQESSAKLTIIVYKSLFKVMFTPGKGSLLRINGTAIASRS